MKIKIEVTQADIDKSRAIVVQPSDGRNRIGSCKNCPIFQAIQRFPELEGFTVGSFDLIKEDITPTGLQTLPLTFGERIRMPEKAQHFSVEAYFDLDSPKLQPFDFEIELPV